jgi:hypothetical protein
MVKHDDVSKSRGLKANQHDRFDLQWPNGLLLRLYDFSAAKKQDRRDNETDDEQDPRDIGCRSRDPAKSQQTRNNGYD